MNEQLERKMAAVKVDDRRARLEISYKISAPFEESDSNSFSEIIGGREDYTETQARQLVVESALAWINSVRAQGFDIGAWDEQGNSY